MSPNIISIIAIKWKKEKVKTKKTIMFLTKVRLIIVIMDVKLIVIKVLVLVWSA